MKSTSLHSWYRTVLPTLKTRKQQIKGVIAIFPNVGATMREVAKILNVPVHTISGRFGELEREGEIRVEGHRTYEGSNQPHSIYKVCHKPTS